MSPSASCTVQPCLPSFYSYQMSEMFYANVVTRVPFCLQLHYSGQKHNSVVFLFCILLVFFFSILKYIFFQPFCCQVSWVATADTCMSCDFEDRESVLDDQTEFWRPLDVFPGLDFVPMWPNPPPEGTEQSLSFYTNRHRSSLTLSHQ